MEQRKHEKHELSTAERALKKICMSNNHLEQFIDTRFLLPTSTVCERLFPNA